MAGGMLDEPLTQGGKVAGFAQDERTVGGVGAPPHPIRMRCRAELQVTRLRTLELDLAEMRQVGEPDRRPRSLPLGFEPVEAERERARSTVSKPSGSERG